MYNFFVADEPPVPQWGNTPPRDPRAIDVLVKAYFDFHYDIRSILRVLFTSPFFKNARFQKIKSPAEVVVGTVKLAKEFTFPSPDLIEVALHSGYMGQLLFNPPSVEGWHTGPEWIDSGTLMERVNFLAGQLGDASKQGVREIAHRVSSRWNSLTAEVLVDACVEQLGGVGLTQETKRGLVEFARHRGQSNTGTEEFTNSVAAILGVLVATKEYQFN